MTYIENIFLCMVSPLLVAALCMGRRQLRFFLFCIAGMGVCLLSAYINTFLAAVCQADALAATAEIAPVVEELMKPNHGVFDNANVLDKVMRALPMMLLPVYDEGDNEFEITYDETKAAIVNILKTLDNRSMMSLLNGLEPDMKNAISAILRS